MGATSLFRRALPMQVALVVIEDPVIRETLVRTLRDVPYEVISARSWDEADQLPQSTAVEMLFTDEGSVNDEMRDAIARGTTTAVLVQSPASSSCPDEPPEGFVFRIVLPLSLHPLPAKVPNISVETLHTRIRKYGVPMARRYN
jgi:hypothetical protein